MIWYGNDITPIHQDQHYDTTVRARVVELGIPIISTNANQPILLSFPSQRVFLQRIFPSLVLIDVLFIIRLRELYIRLGGKQLCEFDVLIISLTLTSLLTHCTVFTYYNLFYYIVC